MMKEAFSSDRNAPDKRSVKAGILLAVLEFAVGAALLLTIFLVLRNQVNRDLSAEELADTALGAMTNADQCRSAEAWELKKYYGIAEEEAAEFSLRLPVSNMDAAELCVVKCAGEEGARSAAEAMKKRLASQIGLFENYGVEQMKLLNAARVFTVGPYAVLIIDESAGDSAAAVLRKTGGRAE